VGTSNWQNIPYCVAMLRRLRPKSFLDVGCGFGRWGVLAREFLDVWEGREARALWQTRIEGIEAFPGCLSPLHGYVYDRLHVGDALDVLPALEQYDVVYMGDVVEHQTRSRALDLIDEARRHAQEAVIVTIPIGDDWIQTEGPDGNPFHAHRSVWQLADFDGYPQASRRMFSDYRGRRFLVIELSPASGMRQTDPVDASSGASDSAQPRLGRDWPELPSELERRVDENYLCRPFQDNPECRIDSRAEALLQLPASMRLQLELERLASERVPFASPLAGAVDSLFQYLVAVALDEHIGGNQDRHPPREVVERLADAVECIAECTRRDRPGAAPLRAEQGCGEVVTPAGTDGQRRE
jgi:hypothetical protein